jgi:hypothetical protein
MWGPCAVGGSCCPPASICSAKASADDGDDHDDDDIDHDHDDDDDDDGGGDDVMMRLRLLMMIMVMMIKKKKMMMMMVTMTPTEKPAILPDKRVWLPCLLLLCTSQRSPIANMGRAFLLYVTDVYPVKIPLENLRSVVPPARELVLPGVRPNVLFIQHDR